MDEASSSQSKFKPYEIVSELGKGSFGTVFLAKKMQSSQNQHPQEQFAIKLQSLNNIVKPMLHLEYDLLRKLKQIKEKNYSECKGMDVPTIFAYEENEYESYMVMEKLDITLEDLVNKTMNNTVSKDALLRITYYLVKLLEMIHSQGYVHRDVKPSNFMLKLNPSINKTNSGQKESVDTKYLPKIYPIDLGLCKPFINPITKKHIAFKQNKKMVGTAIFCSLNTHEGKEQSRRDDLEAVIYLIAYLVKKLPWEVVANRRTDQKDKLEQKDNKVRLEIYDKIYEIKRQTNFTQFLKDQLLPQSLSTLQNFVRKIQFDQQPNYQYIYEVLSKEHFKLTKRQLSQSGCIWQSMMTEQPKQQDNETQKKKIKINFKIPVKKVSKTQSKEQIKQAQAKRIEQ